MSGWLKSNWGYVIAIIVSTGLAGSALILAGQKVDYQGAQSERHSEEKNASAKTLAITVGEPGTYELHYDTSEQEQAESGPLGLSAEWLIAIFTIVLSAATIWLAFATRGLWQVTHATLQHAEVSSERELRAYVFPESIDVFDGRTVEPPRLPFFDVPQVVMIIQNTGATPAYDVMHWAQIRVLDRADESSLRLPAGWDQNTSKSWMGRNGKMTKSLVFERRLTADEIEGIKANTHAIFLHGIIEYKDLFQKKQTTTYRLFYMGHWPPTSPLSMTFCSDGNSAT